MRVDVCLPFFALYSSAWIHWVKFTVSAGNDKAQGEVRVFWPLFLFWCSLIHTERLFWLNFPLRALATLSSAVSVCLRSEVLPALSRKGAGVNALITSLMFVQSKASHCSQLYCCSWLEKFLLFSNLNPSCGSRTTATICPCRAQCVPARQGPWPWPEVCNMDVWSLICSLQLSAWSYEGTCV